MVKVRARPPTQRKGTRSETLPGMGAGERFDLTIIGSSKSERIGPFSSSFHIGLVMECVAGGLSS